MREGNVFSLSVNGGRGGGVPVRFVGGTCFWKKHFFDPGGVGGMPLAVTQEDFLVIFLFGNQ